MKKTATPWSEQEDALVMPLVTGPAWRDAMQAVSEQTGRTFAGVEHRIYYLRGRLGLIAKRDMPPQHRSPRISDDAVMVERRCLRCRRPFQFDRKSGNFFLCPDHRADTGSPYEPGNGTTGRRAPRLRA